MARNRGFGESAEQNNNPKPVANPATEKQIAFIHRLLDEKNLLASPSFFDAVNAMDHEEYAAYIQHIKDQVTRVDKKRASGLIETLIALPSKDKDESRTFTPDADMTAGVYEVDGVIYIVKPNRDKTRLYAKRLVEINAERATEAGTRVEIEFEYEAGAMKKIKPEHKMPLEKAKELTIRYGRCIVCGRTLKAAESVERGIGPICIKSFA